MIGFAVDNDLVTVRYDPQLDPCGGYRIRLWDIAHRSLIQEFVELQEDLWDGGRYYGGNNRESPYFRGHVLCGHGRFLASGSRDKNLYLYDLRRKIRLKREDGYLSAIAGWDEQARYASGTVSGMVRVSADLEDKHSAAFGGSLGPYDSVERVSVGGNLGVVIVSVYGTGDDKPVDMHCRNCYYLARAVLDAPRVANRQDMIAPLNLVRLKRSESSIGCFRLDVLDDSTALSWNQDGRMCVWDLSKDRRVSSCKFRNSDEIMSIDIRRVDPKIVAIAVKDIGLMLFDVGSSMEKEQHELLRNRFGVEIEE